MTVLLLVLCRYLVAATDWMFLLLLSLDFGALSEVSYTFLLPVGVTVVIIFERSEPVYIRRHLGIFSIILDLYYPKDFIAVIFMSPLLIAATDCMFLLFLLLDSCALPEVSEPFFRQLG